MRLSSFHQKARLSAASAIDQLRSFLAKSDDGTITHQLDLSELEDRILLSASPAAVLADSAPTAESAEVASPLETGSASLFETSLLATPLSNSTGPSSHDSILDSGAGGQISSDIPSEPSSLAELDEIASQILAERDSPSEQAATEVVFVDEAAEDYEQLIADLQTQRDAGRAIDFFVLDSQQDGIDQIAETLDRYSDLDAVHIVSHGTSGAVKLGATWLRIGSLDAYAGAIAGWGNAIGSDGDILIYGCDLAATSRGEMLVDSIAALTSADVAASTDDTGHVLFGGDWELEYQAGVVETSVAFSDETQQNWSGLLAVITVDTFNDLNDGGDTSDIASLIATPGTDGISLREAIIAANNTAGADEIMLGAGTYSLSIDGTGEDLAATGDLDITDDLTLTGAGADVVIIDASTLATADRVFNVLSGTSTLSGVTITGGSEAFGGAIETQASTTLNLTDVAITGNNATNHGGAIFMRGISVLNRVTIDSNTAVNRGGAIYFSGAGNALLTNVTFSGNSAGNGGGGLFTFNTNVTLINNTIVGNSTGIEGSGGGAVVSIQNTILDNTGDNSLLTLTSLGANIDSNGTAAGLVDGVNSDKVGTAGTPIDPLLGTLQDNGGTTKTHAPLMGSPAIDAGIASGAPTVDQRGATRDASPDIGAVEFISPILTETGEFLVNATTTDIQDTSAETRGSQQAVSMAADGSYVVVWSSVNQDGSGWGVYARRFDATGTAITGEIAINETTNDNQQWARVASDTAGNFVVTWTSTNQDGTPQSVYARRFDAAGTALTSEFRVHSTASGTQKNSSIAMAGSGNFVIAWEGNGPGDSNGIFARRFDATGTPLAAEFLVNTDLTSSKSSPTVSVNDSGAFIVAWDDGGVQVQRYDNTGAAIGGEINVDSTSSAGDGSVALHDDGSFVVVWRETFLDIGVYARRYDSAGTPLATAGIVNTSTIGNQTNPSVTMDASGEYIIVWEGPGSGDSSGIFARKYDSSGTALTNEFLINDTTTNTQSQASVAMLDADNYVIVWSGEGAGDVDGVFARQFHDIAPVLDLDADDSSGAGGSDFNAAFADGTGPVSVVDSDATLTDANDTDLESLVVSITDRQDGSDELLAADTSGTSISASFNFFTGVLTLSGTDTVPNYEQVLRTVTYDNGQIPATGASRTITFVASDGVVSSNVGTTQLAVNATNSAPTITSPSAVSVLENQTSVMTVTATDPDTNPLTYTITGGDDSGAFSLGLNSGVLTFNAAPDFESPTDMGGDNVYDVQVQVSDGVGGVDTQDISVTVTNQAITTITTTGSATVDSGAVYTLNLAADEDATSWTINWGDGTIETIAGNPSTAVHTYNSTGFTFNILASATDADGTYLQNELLVPTYTGGDSVFRFAPTTGAFLEEFATGDGLNDAIQAVIGPDGHLYVSGEASNNVLRYNAATGAFIDEFVVAGSGGLNDAAGLAFGPGGNLYVASYSGKEVLRFDGTTGAFVDALVDTGTSNPYSLTFAPDGNLLVGLYTDHEVQRFNSVTGAFIDVFVGAGSGGLNSPEQIIFGPDGNLYVASYGTDEVLRYNGSSGAFIDSFVPAGSGGLDQTTGLTFGPDGNLYVTGEISNNVLRYDGTTGAFVDEYVAAGSGGLATPTLLTFLPEQQVTVNNTSPAITSNGGGATASATVAENTTAVTTVTATDVDLPAQTLTYSISGGADAAKFNIDSGSGVLTFASAPDFESPTDAGSDNVYDVQVQVSDGLGGIDTQDIAVTVSDVNDVAPVIDLAQSFNVAENVSNLAVVGTVTASDADTTGEPRQNWMITGGDPSGVFTINGATGQITIADNSTIDFDTLPTSYALSVTTSDGANISAAEIVTINLTDVNDIAPVIDPGQSFDIAEDIADLAVVGTVTASDADTTGEPQQNWMITGGDPAGVFTINGATGQITIADNSTIDFDTLPTSYALSVTTSDGANISAAETVTINLTDVNESPVVTTSVGNASFTEDLGPVAIDSALTVSDPEDAGFVGAEVRFDSGFVVGQDDLLFTNQSGISGSYNTTSGVLTLSGSASVAAYETALRTVTYSNASQNPNTGNRLLRFTVNDGLNVNSATRPLTVTALDDPANVVTGGPYAVSEGASVVLDGSASNDIDNFIVEYTWDFDYDGVTFNVDATGSSTNFSAAGIDGPDTRTIALRTRSDNGIFAIATTTVTISNVAPTANADSGAAFATAEDSAFITGNVLINDTDPGPESLTVSSLDTTGTIGQVIDRGDGTFTYNPNGQFESLAPGQSANDTFTYTVTDGNASDMATVTILVSGANDAPVVTDQNVSVDENAVLNTLVTTAAATDIDAGDSVSWTITGGNTNAAFSINSTSGDVRVAKPLELDFESNPSYSLSVRAADENGGVDFGLITVSLNDLNEAPTANNVTLGIAENSAFGVSVGFVSGSDPDTGDAITWSMLSGNTNGVFAINSLTGEVTVANSAALDFEVTPSFNLVVEARDVGGLADTAIVAVDLTNQNETPSASDAIFGLAENSANGTVVGIVAATDPDTGDSLTWSIVNGNVGGAFTIGSTDGQISVANSAALDFEVTPAFNLTVEARDVGGLVDTANVAVDLVNQNETPSASDAIFGLAENSANGTVVGAVSATDPDAGDSLTWSIVSGNVGGAFTIGSTSGQISVANSAALDFEVTPAFNLTVRVQDAGGEFDTAAVAVSLADQNEAPIANDAVFAVGEDAAPGLSVGVFTASDPDSGDTRTWSILSGNTNGAFSLNAATGELTVASPSTLDFETTPTYTLNVQVQDAGGLTDSATVVVNVSNVDEAPTTTGLADVFVNEDSADVVIDLTTAFNDVETPSAALSYSIIGNSNSALLSGTPIIGGNLTLNFATNANGNAFVTVRATDPQGLFATTAFNVVVAPVADAPTSTADSYVVLEDQLTVPPASGVLANDSDPDGDAISALLVSGPGNGSLVLLSDGGFIYTPNDNFSGIDTFVYEPFDGTSTGPQRTVVLNITRTIAPPPPPADSGAPDSVVSDDGDSAADTDSGESAEVTIDAPLSAVDGPGQGPVVVESTDSAASQANESADDDADEQLAGPYTASETGEDFLSSPAERLELRDATSVSVKTLNDARSDGGTPNSNNRFRDSLRFEGEDLSYLVSTEFIHDLEQVEDEFEFNGAVPEWAAGTAVATTASISVGYIMWMLRGGYVLASVLSTMPVWQNIDPLPVLAALDAADDDDDDSLESMIDRASDEADGSEGLDADEAASDAERKDKIV